MGGRAWIQEELIRLEELTETYPLATVARKLNRSENAVFLKPMKKNIPKGHPEWSLVKCPICGQECWRPMSRQELRQKKMQAACTECGLKIESRRNQP